MAINLGDAVLAFRGDLTQLNLAFDEAAQSANKLAPAQAQVDAVAAGFDRAATAAEQAAAAMEGAGVAGTQAGAAINSAWVKVAQATTANFKAQQELRAALFAVKSTGGDSATAIERLARAQQQASVAAEELAKAQKDAAASAVQMASAEKVAGDAAVVMGEEMQVAAAETEFSMKEAKASIALMGEEVGVKVPRHLRGFVASLPGVGKALEAAFSGVAILILVQLLVEATEKLTEFVGETFIYTEANKEALKAQEELNKAIEEHSKKLGELKEAYDFIGLSGSGKTAKEIENLNVLWEKNESAIRNAQNTLYAYKKALEEGPTLGAKDVTAEEADKAEKALGLAFAIRAEYQQKFLNLNKQGEQELLAESIAAGSSRINAEKTIGDARIGLLQAQTRLELALIKNSYFEQGQAKAAFEQQKYELELETLRKQASNLAQDPTKNANQIRETNAKIEALEREHQAKILNDTADFVEKIRQLQLQVKEQPVKLFSPNSIELSEPGKALQQLQDAFKALGVQGSATWMQQVVDAEAAFEKIKNSGLSTFNDILQAQEKLAEARLGLALAFGNKADIERYQEEIKQLREQLRSLGIDIDKTGDKNERLNRSFANSSVLLDRMAQRLIKERGELTRTGKVFDAVALSATQSFGNAVASAILGQESLGIALRKGLAAEAATIAGKAAMWGLYFLAWGIADTFWNPARASADFAAAAEFFALAGIAGAFAYAINPKKEGSRTEGPDTQPAEGVTQGQLASEAPTGSNIPHFARGGLVSQRTLAIVGDSVTGGNQREAILPLGDPRSMDALREAFAPGNSGGGSIQNIFNIDGVISADQLTKVIRRINQAVKNNDVQLISSSALRVTRRG